MRNCRETTVYRAFAADDTCLYVGTTIRLRQRWRTHSRHSEWYGQAARRVLTGPMDRISAFNLEVRDIWRLEPIYNKERYSLVRPIAEEHPDAKVCTRTDIGYLIGAWVMTASGLIESGAIKPIAKVGSYCLMSDEEILRVEAEFSFDECARA